jgi:lipid-binding SYLF domain-containing protein
MGPPYIILVFINDEALQKFCTRGNWQAGVDGTVTLIRVKAMEREPI